MNYNPNIHCRKSIRLKGYDYSQAGLYFITICCADKTHRFGYIRNGEMYLNEFGRIAHKEWCNLAERFKNFGLDVFQIMPNHMHGIIKLNSPNPVGPGLAPVHDIHNINQNKRAEVNPAPTVSDIVCAYKFLVANKCLDICKRNNQTLGKLWQRNYYEHIIRNERSYHIISNYIIENPTSWCEDRFYSVE